MALAFSSKIDPDPLVATVGCTNRGPPSEWKWPNIPGIDVFKGKLMHSAKWDATYDLTGKTVAVVGGGSSAVQIVPSIQPSESHPPVQPSMR